MVCEWGMSDRIGPLAFGKKDEAIFLGREIAQHREISEQTALEIDSEIKRIVTGAYERARSILEANVEVLHRLAEALLEHELLDGHQVDLVVAGKPLPGKAEAQAVEGKSSPGLGESKEAPSEGGTRLFAPPPREVPSEG
jgi:cell division protease FtsH